jgi:ATP-dependent Lon protease
MATALVSALTGIPTRADVAMTGEITLRGTVLPIGGLTEKLVAARRAGVHTVLVPRGNEKDLGEVPEEVRADLTFVIVDTMDDVLEHALDRGEPPAAAAAVPPELRPAAPVVIPADAPPGLYTH